MLNHLRYSPFTFVCLPIAIKEFRDSSLIYAKFDLIASKLDVNKIEFYRNTKDKTAVLSNSFVVYDFSCPRCGANYIGKTERTLHENTVKHVWTFKNSAVYKHLGDCTGVQHLFDITPLYSSLFTSSAPTQIRNKFDLKVGLSPSEKIFLFASTIARKKWWKMLFISS